MATNTGPDLDGAAAAVALLLDDTCHIHRDNTARDGTVDPNTLVLTIPDPPMIYNGPCMAKGEFGPGTGGASEGEGGQAIVAASYILTLPLDTVDILVGDYVEITSSRRDRRLPGESFVVTEVLYKTMAVSRKCRMRRVEKVL